jgi:hypothetical protein
MPMTSDEERQGIVAVGEVLAALLTAPEQSTKSDLLAIMRERVAVLPSATLRGEVLLDVAAQLATLTRELVGGPVADDVVERIREAITFDLFERDLKEDDG